MPSKWLDRAPWRQKHDAPSAIPNSAPPVSHAAPEVASAPNISNANSAPNKLVGVQGDLLSMEDIYHHAGITAPRRGYSITKVADMIASDHLRALSEEMKRASVLMALDAAGIQLDDILRDATSRQDAINSYESTQQTHFEQFWRQKDEENSLIQAEMDRSTALHLDRIKRNLDEVSREKVTFASWQSTKLQESQRIAEAISLCAPDRKLVLPPLTREASEAEAPRPKLVPNKPDGPRGLAATTKQ